MFKQDELVMYGAMGVCRIVDIGKPSFAAEEDDTLYYFLEPLYKNGIFYAPVSSDKISIRKVISKKEAKRLIDSADTVKADIITTPSIQQLSQQYQSIIDTHDCDDLLYLTKSIIEKDKDAKKHNKKLGQIDKRFKKKAEDLLFGEIAAALGKEREVVEEMMNEKLISS